ncbi:hypothetical protein GGX14DRAFT_398711 [Mycena pura]|uniref:Uncharacterized protein n=1 Tax=Mycena pura TaxID=153505 RepID=A0AAD6Y665_9AGAR|nr:hypothetical protein GGX14DRAFT_398711 [Mycena pura]
MCRISSRKRREQYYENLPQTLKHILVSSIGRSPPVFSGDVICLLKKSGMEAAGNGERAGPLKVGCELWVVVRTNLGQIWPETLAYVRTKRPKFPGCTGIGARRSCALRRERISISAAIKASRARKQADEADE